MTHLDTDFGLFFPPSDDFPVPPLPFPFPCPCPVAIFQKIKILKNHKIQGVKKLYDD